MEILTYKQRYEALNKIFFESLNEEELSACASKADKLQQEKFIDGDMRERCEALAIRIRAKRYALLYSAHYDEPVFLEAEAYLREKIKLCTEKGYKKTVDSLQTLLKTLDLIRPIATEAEGWLLRVRDRSGRQITEDFSVISSVSALLKEKCDALVSVKSEQVFAKGVVFPDLKENVLNDLQTERKILEKRVDELVRAASSRLLDEAIRPANEEYTDPIEYYPLAEDGEGGSADAVALNTPYVREAVLAVIKWSELRGRKASVLRVSAFQAIPADRLKEIFLLLGKRGEDYLVPDLHSYKGETREELLCGLVGLQDEGVRVWILDESGKGEVYEQLFSLVKAGKFSAARIGYHYLSLPFYRDALSVFLEKKIVENEAEFKKLSSDISFMGYEGLNAAVRAFAQGRSWKEAAIAHSLRNAEKGKRYLSHLTAQYLLLDNEWGDYSEFFNGRNAANERKHVDYDDIKTRDPVNIQKILSADMTVFQKCGAISRFCTLYGDDESAWETLSRDEKSERMTEATRLVMRTLGVPILPEVEVLDEEEWKERDCDPSAGGLCCNGGVLILYRESSVTSYSWVIDAICHECFHAFQHMAVSTGWREWYFTELGVKGGRIPEWAYNFSHYSGSAESKIYKVEIVECDARAFARDCVNDSGNFWNLIDFV